MNQPKSKKPSVFALATRAGGLTVELSAEDVMQLRPDWSHAQAFTFLEEHKQLVADAMVLAAMTALVGAMKGGANVQ